MTATADLGFAHDLAAHGDRLAVVGPDGTELTYRELEQRVATAADRLGTIRRLVLLATNNDVDSLVAYLAAVRNRHPVLLAADTGLQDAWDPDVVIGPDGWRERRTGTKHELHPDLALLLSTSGSTGSPKLVRIAGESLQANAAAIAEYLGIEAADRALLSLPMHYCYGLSVINSNLLRGAGVVLTSLSVVDPEHWRVAGKHRVTSLHGVPHTFELLDQVGFPTLPSLRYVTQAGGRLRPEKVREYTERGEADGWDFFVMYGATEATARMAYLPPHLAKAHPEAIGAPIPGGELDVVDGELVFRGPNVMLGYATTSADLALGRTVHELRTGDLARRTNGLFEVTGRKNRVLKLFGLRIDLDQAEHALRQEEVEAICTGTDDTLVIAVKGIKTPSTTFGLPAAAIRIHHVDEFPRLPNGKIDYQALKRPVHEEDTDIRQLFTRVFGLKKVPGDATFTGLGGDSLTYVQMSVALQRILGTLPRDWPTATVKDLEKARTTPPRTPRVETGIVLRAAAILLIVGSHVSLFTVLGGAHLLLVLAGWNFARFALDRPSSKIVRSAALIAVPSMLWLAFRAAVTEDVTWHNVLLVHTFTHGGTWGYWFVEVLVHALLVCAALQAIPAIGRAERARPFAIALTVLAVALLGRMILDDGLPFVERNMTTFGALWFFALGWVAQRARTRTQLLIVLALSVALVMGSLNDLVRDLVVLGGLVLMLTVPTVPVPRFVVPVVSQLAGASLAIYLTHYALFPELLLILPAPVVLVVCLGAGILTWHLVRVVGRLGEHTLPRTRSSR